MTAGYGSSEIWLVTAFAGEQKGTPDNPYAAPTWERYDALMRSLSPRDDLAFKFGPGVFETASTDEWNDSNELAEIRGFRLGRHWTFDLDPETVIRWRPDVVPSINVDDVPKWLFASTEGRFRPGASGRYDHTPEEIWGLLPRGQTIRGGTLDLNLPNAIDRWQSAGQRILRIGGGILYGHEAAWENVHVINGGSYGYEGFPLVITGGLGSFDRNRISALDPATHVLDDGVPDDRCSHITGCTYDQHSSASNDQVTVRLITGSVGERTPGQWVQTPRAYFYMRGNRTIVTGSNMVQAHSAMHSLRGSVTKNYSECEICYYEDTYSGKGIELDDNEHYGYHGVQLLLSPGGVCPEQYSREGYTIGALNRFATNGPQVKLNTLAAEYERAHGPTPATRFIRNINVHASLSVERDDASTVTRFGDTPPQVLATRKGCNPFGR